MLFTLQLLQRENRSIHILLNYSVPPVLKEIPIHSQNDKELFSALDKFGGFPEPFLKHNTRVL